MKFLTKESLFVVITIFYSVPDLFTTRKGEDIKLKVGRVDLNEWTMTSSRSPTLSMSESVFPIGRFFGRITQKEPSKNVRGRTNLRQKFGRIFPKMPEKEAEYLKCFVSFIFSI